MITPEQPELDERRWKQVRMRICQTGEFDPNLWMEMSVFQKYFINEIKKTYRDLSKS